MEYTVYHATWCPFCRAFMRYYKEMLPDGMDRIIDDEMDPAWGEKGIDYVPTVIASKDGVEVTRLSAQPGVGITKDMLNDFISSTATP